MYNLAFILPMKYKNICGRSSQFSIKMHPATWDFPAFLAADGQMECAGSYMTFCKGLKTVYLILCIFFCHPTCGDTGVCFCFKDEEKCNKLGRGSLTPGFRLVPCRARSETNPWPKHWQSHA